MPTYAPGTTSVVPARASRALHVPASRWIRATRPAPAIRRPACAPIRRRATARQAAGHCNPATGVCTDQPLPDGTPCEDGSACTRGDACRAGTCIAGATTPCPAPDACHDPGQCDPNTGACNGPPKVDGTPCDD